MYNFNGYNSCGCGCGNVASNSCGGNINGCEIIEGLVELIILFAVIQTIFGSFLNLGNNGCC